MADAERRDWQHGASHVITNRSREPCLGVSYPMARIAPRGNMSIQYHKILSEGRSVRYDRMDNDVFHLSVIVTEDEVRRQRARRTA